MEPYSSWLAEFTTELIKAKFLELSIFKIKSLIKENPRSLSIKIVIEKSMSTILKRGVF